jgi:hypothetical protein
MILRGLKAVFHWIVALLILFEEWGWEPLGRLLARIGQLPLLRQVERGIAALPPYGALAVFCLPSIAIIPVKLAALWLISEGHHLLGVAIILVAKVAGTAVLARLFALTRPALMRLAWFARLHARWTAWKEALIARVRASAAWSAIYRAKAAAQAALARLRSLLR